MIAPLTKVIDWLSIQKNCRWVPPIDGRNLRLEEAIQFLKGPDFIPVESQPARVEFNPDQSGRHFRFSTPRPGDFVWQAWERPDIWRLPHGHISKSLMPGLTGRVIRWLAPRLERASAVAKNT